MMIVVKWTHRECGYGFQLKQTGLLHYRAGRWAVYWGLTMLAILSAGKNEAFIYFQF